jgi:lysophospholipase L1-like esterase
VIYSLLATWGRPVYVLEVAPTRIACVNPLIESLNWVHRTLCSARGFGCIGFTGLADDDGLLKEQSTTDRVHLNNDAYELVAQGLQQVIEGHRRANSADE